MDRKKHGRSVFPRSNAGRRSETSHRARDSARTGSRVRPSPVPPAPRPEQEQPHCESRPDSAPASQPLRYEQVTARCLAPVGALDPSRRHPSVVSAQILLHSWSSPIPSAPWFPQKGFFLRLPLSAAGLAQASSGATLTPPLGVKPF